MFDEFQLALNVFGLGEVVDLEAQMFKLELMLIEVQMLNLALMPPFCQTPVSCCFYFHRPITFIFVFEFLSSLGSIAIFSFASTKIGMPFSFIQRSILLSLSSMSAI